MEMLASHFIDKFRDRNSTHIQGLSHSAVKAMYCYPWPGNVRELMNNIRSALVMSDGPLVMPEDLGLERRSVPRQVRTMEESRATAEKAAILNAFENAGNNITHAAEYLEISRGTLYRLMEKHAIEWPGKPHNQVDPGRRAHRSRTAPQNITGTNGSNAGSEGITCPFSVVEPLAVSEAVVSPLRLGVDGLRFHTCRIPPTTSIQQIRNCRSNPSSTEMIYSAHIY